MNSFPSRIWIKLWIFAALSLAAYAGPPITKINSSGYIYAGDTNEDGDYISDGSHDFYQFTLPCAGTLSVSITGLPHAMLYTPWGSAADASEVGSLSYTASVGSGGDYELEVYGPNWMSGYYTITAIFTPSFQGPSASFSVTPGGGAAPLSVSLNASASSCPDGTVEVYDWEMSKNGGAWTYFASDTNPLFYLTLALGSYQFRLRVTDSHNLTATTTRTVVVNSAPSVAIVAAGPIVGVGQSVTITGNATDADGNLTALSLEYQAPGSSTWVAGTTGAGSLWNGAAVATKSLAKAFTLSSAGLWRFRAVSTDGLAVSTVSSTVIVTAGPDITLPAAPTTLTASNITALTFTLSWSGATDDIGVTGYEVRRDGTSLGTSSTASMSVTVPTGNTTYQMEVRARDAAGNWSPWSSVKSVTTIPLQPPVASFVASPLGAPAMTSVGFNAVASTDPNGSIVSYAWDFESNGSTDASGVTASRVFTVPGVYTAKLTVTSSSGLSSSVTRQIPVGLAMQVLRNSSGYIWSGDTDQNGDFIGDGSIDTYEVEVAGNGVLIAIVSGTPFLRTSVSGEYGTAGQSSDTAGTAYLVTTANVSAGIYSVDVGGINKSDYGNYSISIGFAPAPRPPVPAFSPSVACGVAPLVVTFDGSATTSPDSYIGSYAWDFGANGSVTSSGPTVVRTFSAPGVYTARLTIADGISSPVSTTKTIIVNGPAPTFVTQPIGGAMDPGTSRTLSVVVTGSPAPTFQWKRGTEVISGATNASLALTAVTPAEAGSYTVVATNALASTASAAAVIVVNPPAALPVITQQPAAQSVLAGDLVNLPTLATGFPIPTFQWFKGATAVPGATNATLSFAHIAPSDVGVYKVVASNALGTATSETAQVSVVGNRLLIGQSAGVNTAASANGGTVGRRIGIGSYLVIEDPANPRNFFGWQTQSFGGAIDNVHDPVTILTMGNAELAITPLFCVGEFAKTTLTAPSSVVAVGQSITVQAHTTNVASVGVNYMSIEHSTDMGATWRTWEGLAEGTTNPTGPSSKNLSFTVTPQSVGKVLFRAMGGNYMSSNWSTNISAYTFLSITVATQAPPVIVLQPTPASVSANIGETITLRAEANGAPAPAYAWTKNGQTIAGADTPSLTISNIQASDAASYRMVATNGQGSVTSSPAVVSVIPKPKVTSAVAATAAMGEPFSYSITGDFTAATYGPISYYAFGFPTGLNFSATTGVLSGSPTQQGAFPVLLRITNTYGQSDFSCLILDVGPQVDRMPSFTAQPQPQAVLVGSALSLSAIVTGNPLPAFQWSKNGVAVPGATNVVFSLNSAQLSDAGTYVLVASNYKGTVSSSPVAITVTLAPEAPSISADPVGRSVFAGDSVTFTVTASGSPLPVYQWRRNGVPLANGGGVTGVTAAVLTLAGVTAANAGSYDVVVSNSQGAATSAVAALAVITIDDAADADGDGIPNGIERVLGTSLNSAATTTTSNGQTQLKVHIPHE